MSTNNQRSPDEIAYRRLKPSIDQKYPKNQFIAIHNGQVVADGAAFDQLTTRITALGLNPKECLVVQAGVDYPEFAYILVCGADA
jgi:hypothetical protein